MVEPPPHTALPKKRGTVGDQLATVKQSPRTVLPKKRGSMEDMPTHPKRRGGHAEVVAEGGDVDMVDEETGTGKNTLY